MTNRIALTGNLEDDGEDFPCDNRTAAERIAEMRDVLGDKPGGRRNARRPRSFADIDVDAVYAKFNRKPAAASAASSRHFPPTN